MRRSALFHQKVDGKWAFKCKCGLAMDGFRDKREAELAHSIHWVGCKENK